MIPDSIMDMLFWASMAASGLSVWAAAVLVWLLAIAASEWLTRKHMEKQR
jgi:hypothetical protein